MRSLTPLVNYAGRHARPRQLPAVPQLIVGNGKRLQHTSSGITEGGNGLTEAAVDISDPTTEPITRRAAIEKRSHPWIRAEKKPDAAPINARATNPTICALSTASGRAAIAIIRISGSACREIYTALCPSKEYPKPRYATLRSLYEPLKPPGPSTILDSSALVLYFPAPHTVTGEDLLELHVHGGPAVIKAVLAAISRCSKLPSKPTIRYAEPGEFTRRAFENGRLDLTQIEALGDTLSAATEQQRRLSVRGTSGRLAKQYESWRQQLLEARGELEALIDFSEDQHFDESPATLCASVALQVQKLCENITAHSANAIRGELLRNGISVSLLGAPNAGKSSLLNLIVGREAAIVSSEAGTTRDVVEVGVDLSGYLCRFGDTAGLRNQANQNNGGQDASTLGEIEREGIRRAKSRAMESDVVIMIVAVDPDTKLDDNFKLNIEQEVLVTAKQCFNNGSGVIVVVNKCDRVYSDAQSSPLIKSALKEKMAWMASDRIFTISCKDASGMSTTQEPDAGGIQNFLKGLTSVFSEMTTALTPENAISDGQSDPDISIWQDSLGASERQRLLLDECRGHLDAFLAEVASPSMAEDLEVDEAGGELDIVLAAESLRAASDCLARITGRGEAGDVEEVLGVVFEKLLECVDPLHIHRPSA